MTLETVGVGGGCHWCTEAVFDALHGVARVEPGWIASDEPDDALSEAVVVHVDPAVLPLDVLVEVHLRTHASGADHALRGRYRSAVYTTHAAQAAAARRAVARFEAEAWPVVTRVLPLRAFRLNEPRYLGYYRTRPEAPFCRTHIDPKLRALRARFGPRVRPPAAAQSASGVSRRGAT